MAVNRVRGVVVTGGVEELRRLVGFASRVAGDIASASGGRVAVITVNLSDVDVELPGWAAEAWRRGSLVEVDVEPEDDDLGWVILVDAPRYAALAVALAVAGYAQEEGLSYYTYVDGVDCPLAVGAAGLCEER